MKQTEKCYICGCDQTWGVHFVEVSNRRRVSENFYCEEHGKSYLTSHCYSNTPSITPFTSSIEGASLADLRFLIFNYNEDQHAVIVSEATGTRNITLNIGYFEASVLYYATGTNVPSRPPTHLAVVSIISLLGGIIEYVIIDRFAADSYYYSSHACIGQGKKEILVDLRPSDALSLAFYSRTPIFISEDLLNK